MNLVSTTRTVDITAEDIKAGKPKNCASCPGAIACQRTFPELRSVEVFEQEVRAWVMSQDPVRPNRVECHTVCPHPEVFKEFVTAFDKGDTVEPVSFELTLSIPQPALPPA